MWCHVPFVVYSMMLSISRQCSLKWYDDWQLMNWKRFGRRQPWLNWGIIIGFPLTDWGELLLKRKTLRIASVWLRFESCISQIRVLSVTTMSGFTAILLTLVTYLLTLLHRKMKGTIFWDIIPCTLSKVNRRFGGTYRLHPLLCLPPAFTLISCSAYSWTLEMDAICFSKMAVDFQQTTWRYFPENSALHNHCCENLKSYN
jgi:hypothetical protein